MEFSLNFHLSLLMIKFIPHFTCGMSKNEQLMDEKFRALLFYLHLLIEMSDYQKQKALLLLLMLTSQGLHWLVVGQKR